MKKRGFTLVELLAVMVILAVIIALVFPAVSSILNKTKDTVNDAQIKKILDAAYDYTLKETHLLPNPNETIYITYGHLIKERLINYDIKNPINNKTYDDNLVISIKNVKNDYKLETKKYSMVKGIYLYTIELDLMDSDGFISKKPVIEFDGYDEKPIVISINVGENFSSLSYKAISNDNKDITDLVIKNIKYKSNVVDKINTFDAGIYYINYSVIDKNGYSAIETVNLIILDDEKPDLIIPDNTTISKELETYDLMNGVSCTDNSGKCDIDISGSINFKQSGKYIIEYSAFDPTGNTAKLKRVITIE